MLPDMAATRKLTLFIPCLVDQVAPEIGIAMVKVLRCLGYELTYDERHTCCGQPAYNGGHWDEARQVARSFVQVFATAERIISPSGSCTAMVRNFYPDLFAGQPDEATAVQVAGRACEFSQVLVADGMAARISGRFGGRVGFHNSCHSYRELGIVDEPLELMRAVDGFEWAQPEGEPVCCGFGGLFSVKFAGIAGGMALQRLQMFTDLGADTIVSNDPGCIMNLRNEARARDMHVRVIHLAEFLAAAMGL